MAVLAEQESGLETCHRSDKVPRPFFRPREARDGATRGGSERPADLAGGIDVERSGGAPRPTYQRRVALFRVGEPGTTVMTEIERDPHLGQRRRSRKSKIGKSLPRVARSVVVSRSYFQSHLRDELPVSIVPLRQMAENVQPALCASPRVSIALMLPV